MRRRLHLIDIEQKTGLSCPPVFDRRSNAGKTYLQYKRKLIEYCGGAPDITQQTLIEEACLLKSRCAVLEPSLAGGTITPAQLQQYSTLTNALSRLMLRLRSLVLYRGSAAKPSGDETPLEDQPPTLTDLFPDDDEDEDAAA